MKPKTKTYVDGLLWARPCLRPASISFGRPRGAKAAGIRYERAVARACALHYARETTHGQWFEYEDASGHHWCQTDVLISWLDGSGHCILECKLSDSEHAAGAREKLTRLYCPVVALALKAPCKAIIVTRHLNEKSDTRSVCDTLESAIALSRTQIPLLHWLGRSPI